MRHLEWYKGKKIKCLLQKSNYRRDPAQMEGPVGDCQYLLFGGLEPHCPHSPWGAEGSKRLLSPASTALHQMGQRRCLLLLAPGGGRSRRHSWQSKGLQITDTCSWLRHAQVREAEKIKTPFDTLLLHQPFKTSKLESLFLFGTRKGKENLP